ETTRCAQQHGCVAVVAAGVHDPCVLRVIRYVVSLVDRHCIHICAQPYGGAVAGSKNANHTRLANVAMNLAAELSKLASDEVGCSLLLEAKLGMRVEVVAPRGHFAVNQIDEMWDLHSDCFQR